MRRTTTRVDRVRAPVSARSRLLPAVPAPSVAASASAFAARDDAPRRLGQEATIAGTERADPTPRHHRR